MIKNFNKDYKVLVKHFIQILFIFAFLIILLFLFNDVSGIFNLLKDCEIFLKKNITNLTSIEKIHCSLLKAIQLNLIN